MKLIMKLVGSLSLTMWLSMVLIVSVEAQIIDDTVYDSAGEALQAGVEYYIRPAITDFGGRFTLIRRNDSCPYYVGQENSDPSDGYPVAFTPFEGGATVIKQSRDVKIEFQGVGTICIQSSLAWLLGDRDPITGRYLIATGEDTWIYPAGNYFRIEGTSMQNVYSFRWCPTEVCPICRLICQDVGPFVEDGKRLLALDGDRDFVFPVVFQKAQLTSTA
ncbi:hypothetical protein FNV43_RR16233 [Rhamnella rubrinervis]|uniref:Uncharacterized protein n=1 Tax=Rhamnella rubrinervis TaxID=2594499 RepID=A0A8K0GV09_9ROSA|nr:hypothetical protein FNV43_RR16233 [Rhamnella rubrinervis]